MSYFCTLALYLFSNKEFFVKIQAFEIRNYRMSEESKEICLKENEGIESEDDDKKEKGTPKG